MIEIQNATIHTPTETLHQHQVIVKGGRIFDVTPNQAAPSEVKQVIDATGLILAPGFFDLQINGAFGADFTANPETIWPVGAQLPQYGVTSFLPTIITAPFETIAQAQNTVLSARPGTYRGAEPLGLHIEGPFLNPQKKGAHNPAHLQQPNLTAISNWNPAQAVRLVTLAPELNQADLLIRTLTERGIVVSAGHSLATFAEAQAGFAAGIRYGTHLFNAMPPIHHREPGLIGALLDNSQITIGIIADGIHVHPALVKTVFQAIGPRRLNLVTDAMAALGMPAGQYQLGDFQVTVESNTARLADGTLAGSILSSDAALRNLIQFTGCSLGEALVTLTETPANLLGLATHKGQIAPGYDADLVLLNAELQVVMTMVGGQVIYKNMSAM